jgi:sigma-B regulation protein RsbU (phosphoserine phosphatase)
MLAEDGAEAWAILQRPDAPEVAILDFWMPHMDGYQVCRLTRQRNHGNRESGYGSKEPPEPNTSTRTPAPGPEGGNDSFPYILLMTSNTSREDLLRIIVAGADDYLLKPFEPLDLKIRVRTAVRIVNFQKQARICS